MRPALRPLLLPLTALLLASGCGGSGNPQGGAALFAKSYGSSGFEGIENAVETPDGGYAFVGGYAGTSDGEVVQGPQLWVTKLDPLGDVQWSRALSTQAPSPSNELFQTTYTEGAAARPGGGFFVLSRIVTVPDPTTQAERATVGVLRVDAAGADVWSEEFDVPPPAPEVLAPNESGTYATPSDILTTDDGGALVCGSGRAVVLEGTGLVQGYYGWLMKIDAGGQREWTRYVGPGFDEGHLFYGNSGELLNAGNGDDSYFVSLSTRDSGLFKPWYHDQLSHWTGAGEELWSKELDGVHVSRLLAGRDEMGLDSLSMSLYDQEPDLLANSEQEVLLLDPNGDQVFRKNLGGYQATGSIGSIDTGRFLFFVKPSNAFDSGLSFRWANGQGDVDESLNLTLPDVRRVYSASVVGSGAQERFELIVERQPVAGGSRVALLSGPTQPTPGLQFDVDQDLGIDVAPGSFVQVERVPGTDEYWSLSPPSYLGGGRFLRLHASNGQVIWTRAFASEGKSGGVDRALDLEVLVDPASPSDWRLVVLGTTDVEAPAGSLELLEPKPWILAFDREGAIRDQVLIEGGQVVEPVWLDGPKIEDPVSSPPRANRLLRRTPDGGLLALLVAPRPHLLALDSNLTPLWTSEALERIPLPSETPGVFDLIALEDGGAVAALGNSIARVNALGEVVWLKRSSFDQLQGLALGADGTLCGFGIAPQLRFECLDLDGNVLQAVAWSDEEDRLPAPSALVATEDGGFAALSRLILPVSTFGGLSQLTTMLQLVKLDAAGEPQWSSVFGGQGRELGSGLRTTADGGFLVSGSSASISDSEEGWLLRLDSRGRVTTSCAAQVDYRDAGLTTVVTQAPGPLDDVAPPLPGTPPQLSTTNTTVLAASPTELLVTRQCSGVSADEPAPPSGLYYELNVVIGAGTGTVTVGSSQAPDQVCSASCVLQFPADSELILSAAPGEGFGFPTWTGGDCPASTSPACGLTLDSARTVIVDFPTDGVTSKFFDLDVQFVGSGSGRVVLDPPGLVLFGSQFLDGFGFPGDTHFLTAIPDTGSSFGGYTGVDSADGNVGQITFVNSAKVVTVRFN